MHQLLTGMAEQASKVISRIVEMTNATYTVPLPSAPQGGASSIGAATPQPSTPGDENRKRKVSWTKDTDETDEYVALSQESCANIVDFVIGELNDNVLTPPTTTKKFKVF